jgi:hypothetical protein
MAISKLHRMAELFTRDLEIVVFQISFREGGFLKSDLKI